MKRINTTSLSKRMSRILNFLDDANHVAAIQKYFGVEIMPVEKNSSSQVSPLFPLFKTSIIEYFFLSRKINWDSSSLLRNGFGTGCSPLEVA